MKAKENTDSQLPPLIFFKFTIKNLNDSEKIFTCRRSKDDYIKSEMYIYDTIKKSKIELFSSSIRFIKFREIVEIEAEINIRSNAEIFKLDKSFLKKLDYTGEKKKIDDILVRLKKNSVIIYSQDTSDLSYFRLQNSNITSLKKKDYKILW
ncbi:MULTISPECIES: hypothetical protein [Flavobacterium]|uniref:hypothetical protein n=1 Tax=Flavobacterium TaxID=237 RepID=UPI000F505806|nr:hypothetical protein [Flavobacterium columnare]